MNIAAILHMLPFVVRDIVGQGIGGAARYEGVRDKIRAVMTNKVAMESGRNLMGSGNLYREAADHDPEYVGGACGDPGYVAREGATKGGKKGSGKEPRWSRICCGFAIL